MREIRPSGSEGGVVRKRHPYPYRQNTILRYAFGLTPIIEAPDFDRG
jgi:hypothetical protein